jgi:adenosylmethionine-8-amino-7-oxononanoate aminotransferase
MSSSSSSTNTTTGHEWFAARKPAGTENPITLAKRGVRHTQRLPDGSERDVLAVGLACSECFSGKNLHKILLSGYEHETAVMERLAADEPAPPLSIHTSSGVPEPLGAFLQALEVHLPWKKQQQQHPLDWCVSLQLEGSSAVWAAIDMVMQVSMLEDGSYRDRTKVAVGATSYHGPPSTSFGHKSPLWRKHYQLIYPVPTAYGQYDERALLEKYRAFLDQYAHEIGVILIEPQWGSSQAALPVRTSRCCCCCFGSKNNLMDFLDSSSKQHGKSTGGIDSLTATTTFGFFVHSPSLSPQWPEHLLKQYVSMAKERGIRIICDEIMCGLGRHGKGTLFVSEAWDLDPDAVTFGKAIATGIYPLSGAILKRGRDTLKANKCSVMQSHTYAGSSTRALLAATAVLQEFVTWLPNVAHLGAELGHIMTYLQKSSKGLFICHGQGLMWGGIIVHDGQCQNEEFRANVVQAFKAHCEDLGVVPYHVPVGGFMVSPVIDIDVATIYELGERLEKAIQRTIDEVGWVEIEAAKVNPQNTAVHFRAPSIASASTLDLVRLASTTDADLGNDRCVPYLHATQSCTTCNQFVCKETRDKFLVL